MTHTYSPISAAIGAFFPPVLCALPSFRWPIVTLRDIGPPLAPLTTSQRNGAVGESDAGRLITKALDSLDALWSSGKARCFTDLQIVVGAMLELQRKGAIHIDPNAVMKAHDALAMIQARHYDLLSKTWTEPIRLTAPERANLESGIHHHGAQMLHSSRGEVMDAIRASTKWTQDQADAIAAKVRRQIS